MAWQAGSNLLDSVKNLGSGVRDGVTGAGNAGRRVGVDPAVNGIASTLNRGGEMFRNHGIIMSVVAAFAIGPALIKGIKNLFGVKEKEVQNIDNMIEAKRREAIAQMQVIGAGNGGVKPDGYFQAQYGGRGGNMGPTPRV
ncbi:MAG TPA: hypothetical protein VFT64_00340 [Rickettsiales bacterium]|nr:hypothetical protein [Rickettsiales bacterium]